MGNHVFVCYAHKDEEFVLALANNLKRRGVPIWLDQWDILPSADWDMAIDEALHNCSTFLIVLSPSAVRSREVRGELRTALDENKLIVPVLYQQCHVPRQLRLTQYIDFTSHKPNDEVRVERILQVVRAGGGIATEDLQIKQDSSQRFIEVSLEPEMILIPAGEFLMGSDPQENDQAEDDEQPQHKLFLPEFYIARRRLHTNNIRLL